MTHIHQRLKPFLCGILILALFPLSPSPVRAQGAGTIIIRDAEIEETLKEWLAPLLKVAQIDPKNVNIVLVQNADLNAFVAGGSNIFIYTGLIDRTANPGELIGVMAHELGHIAGGHLVAGRAAAERASYESILGAVLGIGAAIATGNGQAANAIMLGGQSLAARNYLSHSRLQESSADQAALRFMDGAQLDPSGLESFFRKLESEELLPASQQSPYMRTHPLTRDRIEAIHERAATSVNKDKSFPARWTDDHARMKAKLLGFIKPGQIPWTYDDSDKSIPARYARAIAAYKTNKVDEALKEIDGLLASEPSNPYFLELKGQMLMDFGRVPEAVPVYKKAVEIDPSSGLIRMAYGHALLESGGDAQTLRQSIDNIERALQDEPRSSRAHRLLATAYGKLGNENEAKLHLAEEAVLQRRLADARAHAEGVLKNSDKASREAVHARDILNQIENLKNGSDDEDE